MSRVAETEPEEPKVVQTDGAVAEDTSMLAALGVAMLFAAIGGILIAGIIGSVRIFVLNRKLKKINKALGR